MKKIIFNLLIISLLASQSLFAQLSLNNDEMVNGLKDALKIGISKGSDSASKVNGYYLNPKIKIPFPQNIEKVETALRKVGMGKQVDDFVATMNHGAENAASKAKDIFIGSITKMSITDAVSLVKGGNNSATEYLKKSSTSDLSQAFLPIVAQSLEKSAATKYFDELMNSYSKIPFAPKVNFDLKAYTTQKAIDGLFVLVAEEEGKIRANPAAQATDLLKKVFGN